MKSFETLLDECRKFNKTTGINRFAYSKTNGKMYIGTDDYEYDFKPESYEVAAEFIDHYNMLEPDMSKCFGDALYYKGYKWADLTQEQKDSLINPEMEHRMSNDGVKIIKPELYAEYFENNRSFLVFMN